MNKNMADQETQGKVETEVNSEHEINEPESNGQADEGLFKNVRLEEMLDCLSIPDKDDPNVRVSPKLLNDGEPLRYLKKGIETLHDLFLDGLRLSEGGPCVGWRSGPDEPFTWLTYQQVLDRAQRFGSGLFTLGAKPGTDQFIGIFSQNRVEWKITEQACNSYSMVIVPLYDTLGPEAIEHIITQSELTIVVVDKTSRAIALLEGIKAKRFVIKVIVIMDDISEDVKGMAEEMEVTMITFSDVEAAGGINLKDFLPPKPDDLHTICYTSGTTGKPKGAMLTHNNIVSNVAGMRSMGFKTYLHIDRNDVYLSYLPLAHVMERVLSACLYAVGGSVGFYQGDIKLLLSDVAELRPTYFAMVPRLINKLYDKVWAGASQSYIKKFLLQTALSFKMAKLKQGIVTRNTIWDYFIFSKIYNMLGGRLRICITGAAPIALDVINFMRCALGVPFTEGYGQTEATTGVCVSVPGDYFSGSVGSPCLSGKVKLVDVPEKEYFAKDGKGEVCVKGTSVFVGYYKDEEKTKEAIDEDGWLHTGDVGMWLPSGALKIIDRKKHIFKLAQGEYIAPEKIEQILVQSPPVAQVFVHGNGLKASVVAIVIPDPDNAVSWCAAHGFDGSYEEICGSDDANKLILNDMITSGKQRGLKAFELPKKIYLSSELFSVENNLLTPTFKSKRPQIQARYQDVLDKMYEDLD